ncbi:flavin reductase family protein [Deinococcus pimensis]|uniref:flavin reductase family protein n=1 Tax=Deinococcus pimensis TaxID=309888 RepID=UPI0004820E73|nr:flavin reductase family protein [Deinococcus pimensis]
MRFDMADLASGDRYKLLTGVVVPRPIAWVTTLNPDGSVNAAPYSFYGAMGSDPPLVAFGPGNRDRATAKDTAANVRREREFVVNVVTADLADAMNVTGADFPHGEEELAHAGLTTVPSALVRAPRIAESPVHLECRELMTLEVGRNRVVLGEVVTIHVRDDLMLDAARFHVDTPALGALGRMGGRGGYVRTTDLLEIPRLTLAQWRERVERAEQE